MDLDSRFRPNSGPGGRIILLGDGTEVSSNDPEGELFDHEDEDNDLDSQVNKYNKGSDEREGTPGPQSSAQVTESPSSVQTEKSEAPFESTKEDDKKADTSTTKISEK